MKQCKILKNRECSLCGRKFDVRLEKGNKIPKGYWYGGKHWMPVGKGRWRKSKIKNATRITDFKNWTGTPTYGTVWTGRKAKVEWWECNYCLVTWDEHTKTIEYLIKESDYYLTKKDLRNIISRRILSDYKLNKLIWAMKGRNDIMQTEDNMLIWIKADTPEAIKSLKESKPL